MEDGIFNGKTPAKDQYSENAADQKIIKVANLKKMAINFNNMEYVSPEFEAEKFIRTSPKIIRDDLNFILSLEMGGLDDGRGTTKRSSGS